MRFVYLGPAGEPDVAETLAFGISWVRGVAREVADPAVAARLGMHPHFRLEDDEAEGEGVETPPPAPRPRGRPRKVREDGGA